MTESLQPGVGEVRRGGNRDIPGRFCQMHQPPSLLFKG